MRFQLPCGPGEGQLVTFLEHNGMPGATAVRDGASIVVNVPDLHLADPALRTALTRHFSFMDLFFWVPNGFEDVSFWDRQARWPEFIAEVRRFFPPGCYGLLGTLEARGWFIAGVLAHALGKPVIPVRKYREAFARYPGHTIAYRNWRGEGDRLWLQSLPWTRALRGSSVLFVDDVLETGNSLAACCALLAEAGMTVAGAMYLIDVSEPGVRERFGFPIRSLLRMHGLRSNTAPAITP